MLEKHPVEVWSRKCFLAGSSFSSDERREKILVICSLNIQKWCAPNSRLDLIIPTLFPWNCSNVNVNLWVFSPLWILSFRNSKFRLYSEGSSEGIRHKIGHVQFIGGLSLFITIFPVPPQPALSINGHGHIWRWRPCDSWRRDTGTIKKMRSFK